MSVLETQYISSVTKQFTQLKNFGERAIAQVPDEKIYWLYNSETNSIAIIVKHLAGNMLSRFTDFFTSDGEKKWRDRDGEFINEELSRGELMTLWEKGWDCVFNVLNNLSATDLSKTVVIRNEELTVMEAINRQLTHYAGHVGQIVFLAKMICDQDWKTLTVPRNASAQLNAKMGL